jgi:hypothetical protein
MVGLKRADRDVAADLPPAQQAAVQVRRRHAQKR